MNVNNAKEKAMSLARIYPEYTDCCDRCNRSFTANNPQRHKDSMVCEECYQVEEDLVYDLMKDREMEDYDG